MPRPYTSNTNRDSVKSAPTQSQNESLDGIQQLQAKLALLERELSDLKRVPQNSVTQSVPGRPRPGPGAFSWDNVVCFKCGETGHFARSCTRFGNANASNWNSPAVTSAGQSAVMPPVVDPNAVSATSNNNASVTTTSSNKTPGLTSNPSNY